MIFDNYIPKITGTNTLGNSILYDNGESLTSTGSLFINKMSGVAYNYMQSSVTSTTGVNEVAFFVLNNSSTTDKIYVGLRKNNSTHEYIQSIYNASSNKWISFGNYNFGENNYVAFDGINNVNYKNNYTGFGTSPSTKVHVQSITTQLRLGYDATKYTDLSTGSTGNLTIDPTGDTVKVVGAVNSTGGFFKNGVEITGGGGGISNIGITVPTGLTVSPSAITTNDTFNISLQSGYSIPTTANQNNWTEGYNNQISTVAFSGSTTKQITLTQKDGGQIFGYFTDLTASDWTATTYGIKYGAGNIGVGVDPASNAYIKGGGFGN